MNNVHVVGISCPEWIGMHPMCRIAPFFGHLYIDYDLNIALVLSELKDFLFSFVFDLFSFPGWPRPKT